MTRRSPSARRVLRRAFLVAALAGATSCTPCSQSWRVPEPSLERMIEQPRADALDGSDFFADGSNVRSAPLGTVTFALDGAARDESAPVVDAALLDDGQRRFDVLCAACHGLTGDGKSVVADHMTLVKPRDLHIERLRNEPAQYFVDVATRGYGLMPSYADRTTTRERWAIAWYIKALQLSRHARVDDVPDPDRAALDVAGARDDHSAPRAGAGAGGPTSSAPTTTGGAP